MKNVTKAQVQLIQTGLIAVAALYLLNKTQKAVTVVAENAEQFIGETREVVTEDLNPAHNQNIVNRGFTWLYQKATGSEGTLGTDLADLVHGQPEI